MLNKKSQQINLPWGDFKNREIIKSPDGFKDGKPYWICPYSKQIILNEDGRIATDPSEWVQIEKKSVQEEIVVEIDLAEARKLYENLKKEIDGDEWITVGEDVADFVEKLEFLNGKIYGLTNWSNQLNRHKCIEVLEKLFNNELESKDSRQITKYIIYPVSIEKCSECGAGVDDWEHLIWNNKGKSFVLCEKCGVNCEGCNEVINKEENEFIEYENNIYHQDCFSEQYTYCEECNEVTDNNEIFFDDEAEQRLCQSCWEERQSNKKDKESIEIMKENIGRKVELNYPIDVKLIRGNILPVLNAAAKKFNIIDDNSLSFIINRMQRPEAKAFVKAEGARAKTILELSKNIIEILEKKEEFSKAYPKLKGFQPIPVNFVIEHAGSNHYGGVIAIYPGAETWNYLEELHPGIIGIYNRMKNIGHHPGAFGYARLSLDEDKLIVDNLQSDLDEDQYQIKSNMDRLKDKIKKLTVILDSLKQGVETPSHWAAGRLLESSYKLEHLPEVEQELFNTSDSLKLYKALLSYIKKSWLPMLLLKVREIGLKAELPVYLTSSKMQFEKWNSAPEHKTVDIYDKTPEILGMQEEDVEVSPESLGSQRYTVRRVAELAKSYYEMLK